MQNKKKYPLLPFLKKMRTSRIVWLGLGKNSNPYISGGLELEQKQALQFHFGLGLGKNSFPYILMMEI
jgi:hypothetical protein